MTDTTVRRPAAAPEASPVLDDVEVKASEKEPREAGEGRSRGPRRRRRPAQANGAQSSSDASADDHGLGGGKSSDVDDTGTKSSPTRAEMSSPVHVAAAPTPPAAPTAMAAASIAPAPVAAQTALPTAAAAASKVMQTAAAPAAVAAHKPASDLVQIETRSGRAVDTAPDQDERPRVAPRFAPPPAEESAPLVQVETKH